MKEKIMDPGHQYQARFERYTSELTGVNKQIHQISNLRLLIFVVIVIGAVLTFRADNLLMLTADLICGIVVFAAVVFWHNYLHRKSDNLKQKIWINRNGLMRLNGEWNQFKDTGDEFIDYDHPYTRDLDIFGNGSVFQWISVCHTFRGRKILASQLSESNDGVKEIIQKQEAVRELASHLDWKQELEFHGLYSDTGINPEKLLRWSAGEKEFIKNKVIVYILKILPYVSFITGCVGFLLSRTIVFFVIMYSLQLLIFAVYHSKVIKAIQVFEKHGPLLLAYSRLLNIINRATFLSEYLKTLKQNFALEGTHSASQVFYSLSKILSAADVRNSPMAHIFANAIFLWDFQCIINADRLKRVYGSRFGVWIETIGQFEALSSLSVIGFENPDWIFPVFSTDEFVITGEQLGHPLLNKSRRIVNDYPIHTGGTVAIFTGSNMSGKSTFLRTIGINLVLAHTGSPVCASVFRCSKVNIYSSMRINDDLSTGVSTFYAELIRIKKMVEAVKRGERVLFLLDELFRGTNSEDRHEGAIAVLNALSNPESIGLISTHDLKLCSLENDSKKRFINYHFKEQYNGSAITFDYKLNLGQSRTKNAMFLIKMMGI